MSVPTPTLRTRLGRARTVVRRAVLRRRRLLAALCAGGAVLTGVQATAPPPPATVPVLTAASDLAAGEVLGPGDLVTVHLDPTAAPDALAPDPLGRTLAAPLRRGEPVTDVRLVGPSLLEEAPGLEAVPVRLPDAGVVALLRTGDVVDLVAADPQGEPARTVADGVRVLAVPAAEEGTGTPPGRLVVLGVPEASITSVADAASRLYLTVVWSR